MNIECIPVTSFEQNCRVIFDDSGTAVVVDPGGDADQIAQFLVEKKLELKAIWLTHSHLDHCGGVAKLLRHKKVPLYANPIEKMMRENVVGVASLYGMQSEGMENCPEPDFGLSGGETISVGNLNFKVLFTPGHSPGHLCFLRLSDSGATNEASVLVAGDTVFAGSIGRTDLPGGSHPELIRSIKSEILSLPDNVLIMSGHGPDTSVGRERKHNPFLQGE